MKAVVDWHFERAIYEKHDTVAALYLLCKEVDLSQSVFLKNKTP